MKFGVEGRGWTYAIAESFYSTLSVTEGQTVVSGIKIKTYFYTPPHVSGGVLCFHVGRPCVCPSVRPSVRSPYVRPSALHFRSIT